MYRPLSSGPIQYKSTHHPSAARPERLKNHSSGEEKDRINYWSCLSLFCAPVAQLDRALASEARGRVFESRRAHHFNLGNSISWRNGLYCTATSLGVFGKTCSLSPQIVRHQRRTTAQGGKNRCLRITICHL